MKVLGEVRDRYGFSLGGYVVMPEHIHLLMSEPAKGMPSTIMQVLKQRVSRRLRRKTLSLTRNLRLAKLRIIYCLRSGSRASAISMGGVRRIFVEKLQYMHMNPVKRKLVVHPQDWPWSSFSFYARKDSGFVGIDPVS